MLRNLTCNSKKFYFFVLVKVINNDPQSLSFSRTPKRPGYLGENGIESQYDFLCLDEGEMNSSPSLSNPLCVIWFLIWFPFPSVAFASDEE